MLIREIGRSGISASAIGLGTWAIGGAMWGGSDDEACIQAIKTSIDAGISLIDSAPGYGLGHAEELVGKAIAGRRQEVVIATKCGLNWHHAKGNYFFDQYGQKIHRYLGADGIAHELEQSLKRLGTDYIDLYITHWQDPTTPIADTMATLETLKQAGKIRAIGASNLSPVELDAYLAAGQLDAIQERYSMIDRDLESTLLPQIRGKGVSTLSYSPLAMGLLTGAIGPERVFDGDDLRKDNARFSVSNRQKVKAFADALKPIAHAHSASVAQLVVAWTLRQPGIDFVLCGARNSAHALENANTGHIELDTADLGAIDAAAAANLSALDA